MLKISNTTESNGRTGTALTKRTKLPPLMNTAGKLKH